MITGVGTTAKFTRQFYGKVPWLWICDDIEMVAGAPQHDRLFQRIKNWVDEYDQTDVVISSQVQIGTTHRLEVLFPDRRFAYMPENYRVVNGDPERPARWVVGTRSNDLGALLAYDEQFLQEELYFVSPEDAEMVKHATNVWLAMSIEFGKEIAALGEQFGANPNAVSNILKNDPRIGKYAYISPEGEPSAHLKREVWNLQRLGGGKIIDVLESR